MATTNNLTTTYAGEFAGKYISAALLSGKTLAEGNITIVPNVKFKQVMKKVSTNGIVKDATCDFDPTSTLTLTERILQPEEFQVNLTLCKKDFRSDWEAIQQGISVYDQLPPKFSDFLISHVAGLVAQKTEQNIWAGVNANAGEFDGFTVLMAADSDVIDSTTTETAYSSSNIVSLLSDVVDNIPNAIYGKEDLKLYVPPVAWQAYIRHLGGYGANGLGAAGYKSEGNQWWNNNASLSFEGIEVVYTPGMPTDHIVAAQKSNLYFGTGLLSDHQEVKVLDMADLDGSQNVRIVMRFTSGVQYGIGSEIVLQTLA